MENELLRQATEDLSRLALAWFVDQRGGQVAIPARELHYPDVRVRIALDTINETIRLTLITEEYARETLRNNPDIPSI